MSTSTTAALAANDLNVIDAFLANDGLIRVGLPQQHGTWGRRTRAEAEALCISFNDLWADPSRPQYRWIAWNIEERDTYWLIRSYVLTVEPAADDAEDADERAMIEAALDEPDITGSPSVEDLIAAAAPLEAIRADIALGEQHRERDGQVTMLAAETASALEDSASRMDPIIRSEGFGTRDIDLTINDLECALRQLRRLRTIAADRERQAATA